VQPAQKRFGQGAKARFAGPFDRDKPLKTPSFFACATGFAGLRGIII
jgi:hypothetical protein